MYTLWRRPVPHGFNGRPLNGQRDPASPRQRRHEQAHRLHLRPGQVHRRHRRQRWTPARRGRWSPPCATRTARQPRVHCLTFYNHFAEYPRDVEDERQGRYNFKGAEKQTQTADAQHIESMTASSAGNPRSCCRRTVPRAGFQSTSCQCASHILMTQMRWPWSSWLAFRLTCLAVFSRSTHHGDSAAENAEPVSCATHLERQMRLPASSGSAKQPPAQAGQNFYNKILWPTRTCELEKFEKASEDSTCKP